MVFFLNSSSRCQWSTWLKGYLWLYCGVISREVVTQALEEKAHIRLFWIEKIGAGELKLSGALTKDGINSKLKNHRKKKDMHDVNYRCKFCGISFIFLPLHGLLILTFGHQAGTLSSESFHWLRFCIISDLKILSSKPHV